MTGIRAKDHYESGDSARGEEKEQDGTSSVTEVKKILGGKFQ